MPADGAEANAAFCDEIAGVALAVSIGEGYEGIDSSLAAAEDAAPDEIRADVTTMADENRAQVAARCAARTRGAGHPSDDFFAAATTVGDYMADNCGYQVIDVTAMDYALAGIPTDAEAGTTLIRITNDGVGYHEVVLQRVHRGETRSIVETLALPEEEGGDFLDYLGSAFAPPGLGNWTVVNLSAGRHAAVCFIPTGATTPSLHSGQVDDTAWPHASQDMLAEMQVS